jgi:hypothetical protein
MGIRFRDTKAKPGRSQHNSPTRYVPMVPEPMHYNFELLEEDIKQILIEKLIWLLRSIMLNKWLKEALINGRSLRIERSIRFGSGHTS